MERRMVEIPHVQQALSWDCGLACVKMIAKLYHLNIDFDKACQELNVETSVWTIDLAYILAKYALRTQLYTITLGVDETYAEQPFYKHNYDKDLSRIQHLFENAPNLGLSVEKHSTSSLELAQHILTSASPAIVLVDYNHLFCDSCSRTCMFLDTAYSLIRQCGASYQGHYIVICGVDVTKARFYYRNPSFHDELCTCSFECMDRARFQHGTDEDVLLVFPPDRTG